MAHMAEALARPRKTVEDYMALPDDVRAELIDGEFYLMPSPGIDHQDIALTIAGCLRAHALQHDLGRVFIAPLDVHLPSGDIVQPDVLFVSNAHADRLQHWVRGQPDLAVEVVSPSRPAHDRIVKRQLYARNGVPEYWIVDPTEPGIEVLRLDGDAYAPAGWFTPGKTLVSKTLPDLRLAVDDVFRTP